MSKIMTLKEVIIMTCSDWNVSTTYRGHPFCYNSCGAGKYLQWYKFVVYYKDGTQCSEDVYIGCC